MGRTDVRNRHREVQTARLKLFGLVENLHKHFGETSSDVRCEHSGAQARPTEFPREIEQEEACKF